MLYEEAGSVGHTPAIRFDLENCYRGDIVKILQEARIQDLKNLTFLSQDENTDTIERLKI